MKKRDPISVIAQAIDMIGDDLEDHPLQIERPGKEDYVLISARTYSMLLQKIYDLEQNGMTSAEREAEEEELLKMMVDASNSGPLN